MIAASEHIKEMLIADDKVATTTFTPLIGILTATYSNCMVITDYAAASDLNIDPAEEYERPSVQIRVRSNGYTEGINFANSVKKSLHGRANETWGGITYALIKCLNGPMFIKQDENQRIHFVMNFDLQRYECTN